MTDLIIIGDVVHVGKRSGEVTDIFAGLYSVHFKKRKRTEYRIFSIDDGIMLASR